MIKIVRSQKGENNNFFGKHHTKEALEKISIASSNRRASVATRQKISNSLLHHIISKKTREKISIGNMGKSQTDATKQKISSGNKGKKRSLEHRLKYRLSKMGDKNPQYINGFYDKRGKLYTYIRRLKEYDEWKKKILERDDNKCVLCNSTISLEMHHKIRFIILLQEFVKNCDSFDIINDDNLLNLVLEYTPFWDITNGVTVCVKCHHKIHSKKQGGG